MDKQRFSSLLKDPSKVTNADIKTLNEYRKKYPYFQSLYVVVAKALKERQHPKTEAFIKKAAIYSANRSHLKEIIEGEYRFIEKPESKPQGNKTKSVDSKTNTQSQTGQPKKVEESEKAELTEETKTPTLEIIKQKDPPAAKGKVKPANKGIKQGTLEKSYKKEETPQKEEKPKTNIEDINSDLEAIEATKKRIEALLGGQISEPKKHDKKTTTPTSKKKKQIEIIEKFIQDEPRIERLKIAEAESTTGFIDLANKSMRSEDSFETETLAQLMANQGKLKKAEAIYKKLSLKYPEKSTYFATQIQKLKAK